MLRLDAPRSVSFCDGMSRRDFLHAGSLAFLGLIFCAMTFAWLLAYAIAISLAGDFVRRRAIWRTIEAITGAALVALGLRLATERQ